MLQIHQKSILTNGSVYAGMSVNRNLLNSNLFVNSIFNIWFSFTRNSGSHSSGISGSVYSGIITLSNRLEGLSSCLEAVSNHLEGFSNSFRILCNGSEELSSCFQMLYNSLEAVSNSSGALYSHSGGLCSCRRVLSSDSGDL